MHRNVEADLLVAQSEDASARACDLAHVRIADEHDMSRLWGVTHLLTSVWGTSSQGPPIPVDVLRGISHAGCAVAAAYDADDEICGAAVAIVAPGSSSAYSLIAGVRPGQKDAGVGFALKQHQRAWALARGLERIVWTFDPLVSRNARFNLTKLGASATEYSEDFYGVMDDAINTDDESDRLVAVWPLSSERAIACSESAPLDLIAPDYRSAGVLRFGPDLAPMFVEAEGALWCRVPMDIVALRNQDPEAAKAWRRATREVLRETLSEGYAARGVTRTGWYRLDKEEL
ncbi:hypothetical protein [Diaminobutyricibacter sp. McL0608]|uniref:hypothetical protein n=1 Tax=Leifsonia sp. McL0608 TaxID=3143537 RepID=UPI0031F2FF6A